VPLPASKQSGHQPDKDAVSYGVGVHQYKMWRCFINRIVDSPCGMGTPSSLDSRGRRPTLFIIPHFIGSSWGGRLDLGRGSASIHANAHWPCARCLIRTRQFDHCFGQTVADQGVHPGTSLIVAVPVIDVLVRLLLGFLILRILCQGFVPASFMSCSIFLGSVLSGLPFICSLTCASTVLLTRPSSISRFLAVHPMPDTRMAPCAHNPPCLSIRGTPRFSPARP